MANSISKKTKKIFKKVTKRENLGKILIIVSGLALIASSVLPYIL